MKGVSKPGGQHPRAQEPDLFGTAQPLPPGLAYEPGFITAAEEAALLSHIAGLRFREAQYKEYTAKRRVVSYGAEYDFGAEALRDAPPIPALLK